jgi:virulence-associated protein VagC
MIPTKIVPIGNSQAVQLSKAFHLSNDEIGICPQRDEIILREAPRNLHGRIRTSFVSS